VRTVGCSFLIKMKLIEQFDALDLNAINQYLATRQEEHLSLDFKLVNDPDFAKSDDRKNLAKALSGFANSSGGLIVWGIDARKNPQGVDCAVNAPRVDRVARFITRLNELTGQAANPIIDGVRHKAIHDGNDVGFAVTIVPESDSGPHMAKLGEDRYYKRSGDSFYRMEHFDLEDMFGRRKKPKLVLTSRIDLRNLDTSIFIGIENVGRGTAKAPYLAFNVTWPFRPSLYGQSGLPKLQDGQHLRHRYGANLDFVIHAGTAHEVARLDLGINPHNEVLPNQDVIIEYEISAEDIQLVRGTKNLGRIPIT
jgi:hypothetical protein